ncbi:hypothetical protein Bca52824_030505 [Brassica carinata]|uniref:Disease resistance protein n=1 Tax=Brassica carinata TaxID=52824 RepID=A0A8X7SDB6_BRACI|nr:hypothetical protein Bca52824_030505 [Brassica carinata]
MLELRYLILPRFLHDKTKLELSNLVNLDFLWGFSVEHSSVTDLLCMTKPRTLCLHLSARFSSETLPSTLKELRNLEKLCLSRVPEVRRSFLFFRDQHQFPPHLSHISLFMCNMEEDPMPILEKLLHLKSVEFSSGAFDGRRMVSSKGGFPQLRALEIIGQEALEEWIVEEGSMPCLQTLAIDNCKMLEELPRGLK